MIRWLTKSKQKRRKPAAKSQSGDRRAAPQPRGAGPKLSSAPVSATRKPDAAFRPATSKAGAPRVAYQQKYTGTKSVGGAPMRRKKKQPPRVKWYWRRGLWAAIASISLMLFVVGGITLAIIANSLPPIDQLTKVKTKHGIRVETQDGALIATYGEVTGDALSYNQLPKPLIQAVVATEDRRFFNHGGVDVWGIARAMLSNIWHRRLVQGGSTITQQLAKNIFLTPERTLKRKLQEVILAYRLEARYNKQQLLEIYLNRVYFGAGSYGVDAASRRYFGKSAREINLVQSAMIAGLLKAPSRYAPTANAQRARDRAHQVLINMEDAGFLTEAQVTGALASFSASLPMRTVDGTSSRYFADWVVDTVPDYVGHVNSDLVVITTLSRDNQRMAEEALTNVMATEGPAKNAKQSALVALSPEGAVRAMVGGISYTSSQFNRAVQAKRQAGSVFKLFVYLAALEQGFTPQSRVMDAPITLTVGNKTWTPENYADGFKGDISMAQALRESLNTVAVRLTQSVGPWRVASMAKRLGIANVPARPSLALGAIEVSLLELTGAYATLPNNGNVAKPYGIVKIATTKGQTLYERKLVEQTPVLSEGAVGMMNYMLRDVTRRGTGTKAFLPERDTAGKTGTSQDFKDAWFIGFTPQMVTGVWVGNDNNAAMNKVTGGSIPALIWKAFMQEAMKGLPATPIRADANDSNSFMPWFGGDADSQSPQSQAPNEGQQENDPLPAVPSQVPFGLANPPQVEIVGEDGQVLPAQAAPVIAPPPATAKQKDTPPVDAILGKKFWNQLLDEADDVKVEYDYPDSR